MQEWTRRKISHCSLITERDRWNILLMLVIGDLYNILIIGFSFMLLFTAFQTGSMVETLVLDGARKESNGTFSGQGYVSLAILYSVFSVSNWIAPSVVAVLGAKWSMVGGAALYCLFIASLIKPISATLYISSALVGLGAAVLWTAQGNCLTLNSDPETIGRNSGIFWALFQSSLLIGNIYFSIKFIDIKNIYADTRIPMFIVLTVLAVIGTLLLIAIRRPPSGYVQPGDSPNGTPARGPLQAFKMSIRMLFTKEMLLLIFCFAYLGLEQSFWGAVYTTSVGRTKSFGADAIHLTGLCGVFIGVGEILGGVIFGLLGNRSTTKRPGRDTVVLLGFLTHIVAIFLIFLNIPTQAPIADTEAVAYITPPNKYVAIICAFLMGFGDSCYNTQIFPIIGALFPADSASAFALFKFIQSLASAATFVYSLVLELHWQLLILTFFAIVGTILFSVVEVWAKQRERERMLNRLNDSNPTTQREHQNDGESTEHDTDDG